MRGGRDTTPARGGTAEYGTELRRLRSSAAAAAGAGAADRKRGERTETTSVGVREPQQ